MQPTAPNFNYSIQHNYNCGVWCHTDYQSSWLIANIKLWKLLHHTVSPKKIKVNQKWANSTKIVTSTTTQHVLMEICVHLDMNHWQFTNLLFASFGCKEIVQKPTAVLDTCIWKEIEVKSHVFGKLNQVDVQKQIAHFYMRKSNKHKWREQNKI